MISFKVLYTSLVNIFIFSPKQAVGTSWRLSQKSGVHQLPGFYHHQRLFKGLISRGTKKNGKGNHILIFHLQKLPNIKLGGQYILVEYISNTHKVQKIIQSIPMASPLRLSRWYIILQYLYPMFLSFLKNKISHVSGTLDLTSYSSLGRLATTLKAVYNFAFQVFTHTHISTKHVDTSSLSL